MRTLSPNPAPVIAEETPPWWRRIDRSVVALVGVAIVAFVLRIYDINWDQNQHLHPDERKITMVAQCLGWHSVPLGCPAIPDPANPHFFAYGSFPMYLLALVANGLAHLFGSVHGLPTDGGAFNDYNHITLVGRALSALFDTGTVVVTGLLARRLLGPWWGVTAAALVAFSTINVQLSHYYAVDTVLTFFVALTLLGTIGLSLHRPGRRTAAALEEGSLPRLAETLGWALLTGLAAGLALTSKISAAPLALPIGLALLLRWRRLGLRGWIDVLAATVTIGTTTLLTFIATMPYALLDSTDFWHDVNEQNNLAHGVFVYPYTIQFANRTPYLDQLKNLFVWDLGACFMVAAGAGILVALVRLWHKWDDTLIILLGWVLVYFGITGGFYMKFPRYQLPIVPALAVLGVVGLRELCALSATPATGAEIPRWRQPLERARHALTARLGPRWPRVLGRSLAAVTVAGGVVLTFAYLAIYHDPMTRLAASDWMYAHVAPGSNISHEIWDDALPLQRGLNSPYNYRFTDLGLYDPDTTAKADTLANQLAGIDVIVVASNRLYTSISRVPYMYPLTAHYYQLLYSGQLGFHLTQTFANSPHLGPFALPDSTADESFSVYDHPTVWIFTRDAGQHMDASAIEARLLAGVALPAQSTALASQKPLLLSANDIAADNQNAPLWQRFSPTSWQTTLALPLWWLTLEVLGLLAFPLAFVALPGLKDRGWGLAKALGVLGLSYLIWLPASLGVVPYEERTVWLAALVLGAIGGLIAWRQWNQLVAFFRAHWRLILLTEGITLVAFLAFVAIRAYDPDLWHIYRGGEKPMELTFLNGILRSRTLPPLDPWFAGSYINYYYFGQFLVATLIELTGIVPTTAFNLAIPMLFALTFSGALSVIGGISGRWWVGLLGGWAVVVAGNLDGLRQWWQQFQASQGHLAPLAFDYWQSSRIIPFTINEFPFWSFLYADLHAHVIDLPIILLGVGVAASLLNTPVEAPRWHRLVALGVAALALGAMACINTWDMPTYGGLILLALLIAEIRALPRQTPEATIPPPTAPFPSIFAVAWLLVRMPIAGLLLVLDFPRQAEAVIGGDQTALVARGHLLAWWSRWPKPIITWAAVRDVTLSMLGVVGGAFALFLPFYAHFQSLYGKIGTVTVTTDPILFLTIFGFWLFLIATFFTLETLDRWSLWAERRYARGQSVLVADATQRALLLCFVLLVGLTYLLLRGVKPLLVILIIWGLSLLLTRAHAPAKLFTYLVLLVGLGVALVVELIYLRDFLDGGDWERMNTVFKFEYQVWLLFALGGALVLGQVLQRIVAAFQVLAERFAPGVRPAAVSGTPALPYGRAALAFAASGQLGDTGPLPVVTDETEPDAEWDFAPNEETPRWLEAVNVSPAAMTPPSPPDPIVGWALRGLWLLLVAALIFGSSIFLIEGTEVRIQDRTLWTQVQPPPVPAPALPSLDGFAYMHSWYPGDADAITWMNEHIGGDPVIIEGSADPYHWFGRVAINTGLPSVLGWANHESQQRYADEVFQRSPDVTTLYTSNDPVQVMTVVNKYHVHYIYVGQLECLYYALHESNLYTYTPQNIQQCDTAHSIMGPLQVFPQMVTAGTLRVAYSNAQVTLYEVVGP